MPINITITDLKSLTRYEADHIYIFLTRILRDKQDDDNGNVDEVKEAFRVDEAPKDVNTELKKPRKKRKTKVYVSPPEHSANTGVNEAEPLITHAELVAYILENTRTKKIDINQIMGLLAEFNIPGLHELEKRPEVLTPFYEALKLLINS